MKFTLVCVFVLLSSSSSLIAQVFTGPQNNPFGINIDTSGGVEIFSCDFVDIDNDGDIDIVYSYAAETAQFAYQQNIGTAINPIFSPLEKLDYQFDIEIGLEVQDFEDMNNDGLVDFISFGAVNDSTGFNCTYFENKGNNVFESRPGAEIGLPGIGYALGIPEIVDLNQDGDKDLILAGALFETFTDEQDVMFYYGQNSDATDPTFTAWFIEPYSFSFMDTFQSAIIKTGDLDLDGDLDLFLRVGVTDEDFKFMYQENISPPNEKNDFSEPQLVSPFGLPEESSGLPFLEDIDGDGDLDLFLFDEITMVYYENTACVNTNSSLSVSLCGETSYTLNDESYSSSGSYSQVIANAAGCDSTILLNLTLNNHIDSDFEANICEGSSYNWNGEEFMIAGEYQRVFTSISGCDSLLTLVLNVSSVINTSFEANICEGSSYNWNGEEFMIAGEYQRVFTSISGCDSLLTLVLNVSSVIRTNFEDSFSAGSEYAWNDQTYNMAGSYEQAFATQAGCDSVVTLDLMESIIEYQIDVVDNIIVVDVESADISWFDCDTNMLIDGENQKEFISNETGNFAAIIGQNECEIMTTCFNVIITSIEDIGVPEFRIFPNPTSYYITLKTGQELPSNLEVQIYNMDGKMVNNSIAKDQIDVSDLNPGCYILNIKLEQKQLRLPFIKVE